MSNEEIRKEYENFINDKNYKKYLMSNEEEWLNNLEEVKKYIDSNNKKPSQRDKNEEIKKLSLWIVTQQQNYKKHSKIMTNEKIIKAYENIINDEKYKKYFMSNEEELLNNLEEVKKYIDLNNKKPSKATKNKEIKKLGLWITMQKKNYKEKTFIMKNKEIIKEYENFINDEKYKKYFKSNKDDWLYNLEEVKKYIDLNNKKPSSTDINEKIKKLSTWIDTQQANYKNQNNIMINKEIIKEYENFINDINYKKYFKSNEEEWLNNLEEVKKYIELNNKRPSTTDINEKIKKIGRWICTQQQNYTKKCHIMIIDDIRKEYENFINNEKYKKYLMSNDEEWLNNLEEVKKYIDLNNKKPYSKDANEKIKKLGLWIINQNQNYKKLKEIMVNEEIIKEYDKFISDEKYKKHFLSYQEEWLNNLEEVKKYIDLNNKRPSPIDKKEEINKLGKWISRQQQNYKKKSRIMINEYIYNEWKNFINLEKYKKIFIF